MTESTRSKPVYDHSAELSSLIDAVGSIEQKTFDALLAEKNGPVEPGPAITHKARIFSGNQYRVAVLCDYLQSLGCNQAHLDRIRANIFGNTIGLCTDIPEHGLRGELISMARPTTVKQQNQNPPVAMPENKPLEATP